MNNFKKYILVPFLLIALLATTINIQIYTLNESAFFVSLDFSVADEGIRNLKICTDKDTISAACERLNADMGELITVSILADKYELTSDYLNNLTKRQFVKIRNKLVRFHTEEFNTLKDFYSGLIADIEYFPVPKSIDSKKWVSYVDSWGYERTYGGERRHEGTDIMAQNNTPGLYPVISVCDGTITAMGWLELGGYRIGITSDNGIYYYYAHLDSYADGLKIGDTVTAGQFLGFMGNTGYSKVEGTKGKFDVHLHFGVYYKDEIGEIAMNPYYLLKILENKVLYYNYSV